MRRGRSGCGARECVRTIGVCVLLGVFATIGSAWSLALVSKFPTSAWGRRYMGTELARAAAIGREVGEGVSSAESVEQGWGIERELEQTIDPRGDEIHVR